MLPAKPASAIDCVSPAIEWTKRAMLQPFSWAKWWRIGLVGAAIGEMSGASCNLNTGHWEELGKKHPDHFLAAQGALPFPPEAIHAIVITLVIGVALLALVHLYVASVLRFVYFDAVATGRYRLREGWMRWHAHGFRWFLFSLLVLIIVLAIVVITVVPAVLLGVGAYKAIGGGGIALLALIGIPVLIVIAIVAACVGVLVKDFAIPMMALGGMAPFDAFKQVIVTAWHRKGEHAGYLGMKIVLAIAFGIAAAIVEAVIALLVILPIVGAAIAGGVLGSMQGGFSAERIFSNPAVLAMLVIGFLFVLFLVLGIAAIVLSPALFFFEAYVLTWLAQRYEPLWNLLYPAPPPGPLPPETAPA